MSQSTDIWPEIWALKRKVGGLTGEDEPTYVYAPYSLSVYGGYRSIHISWEHRNSSKAVRTEIWTSTTPVREEASMVGRVEGQTFAVHDLEPLQLWHVWIRTVNVAIEDGGEFAQVSDWVGPETAITKAVELEDFPEIIIEESILAPLLNEKIQKIDLLDDDLYRVAESLVELLVEVRKGDVNLAEVITTTKTTLEEGVRAEAEARQLVVARIDKDVGDVEAYVGRVDSALATEEETRALAVEEINATFGDNFSSVNTVRMAITNEQNARAEAVTGVQAQLGSGFSAVKTVAKAFVDEENARTEAVEDVQAQLGSGFSAVQTVSQAVANVNGTVNALWTVKVDANGKVAGIGLVSDGTVTEFAIRADRFFMLTDNATGQQQQVFQIANGQLVFFGDIFAATMTKDGLMTGGNIVGNKIWAQSAISLNNGGKLVIGTGGILSVGTSAYISATRAAFNVSQFFIQSGTPGSSGGSTPFYVSGGVVYMNMAMIKAASITDAMIANAAITNAKIENLAVTNAKLANATIETAKIKDGAITNAKIANAAIDTAKIANASITAAKIKDGEITNAKIANASITAAKIQDASITSAKIQDASIENADIKNLTINGKKIAANAVSSTFTTYTDFIYVDGTTETVAELTVDTGDTGGTDAKVLCWAVGEAYATYNTASSGKTEGYFLINGTPTQWQRLAAMQFEWAPTGFCVCAQADIPEGSSTVYFRARGPRRYSGDTTKSYLSTITFIATILKK